MTPSELLAFLLVLAALFFIAVDWDRRRRERRRPDLSMQAWRLGLRTDRDEPLHRLERRVQLAMAKRERP